MKRIARAMPAPAPRAGARRYKISNAPSLSDEAKKEMTRIENVRAKTAGKASRVRMG